MKFLKSFSFFLIIISVLLSDPFHDIEKIITGKGRSDTERVGDFLQIALPSYGLYKTYKIDDRDGRRQLWKSLLSTFAVTYALKYGIDKTRPNGDCCESFPSGHTSIAFSGATFLAQRYGHKMGIPAYIMASFVGYSRVYADKHYWEDVLAGAAIGYGLTSLCTKEYMEISYMPYINRSDYGIFISVNIN